MSEAGGSTGTANPTPREALVVMSDGELDIVSQLTSVGAKVVVAGDTGSADGNGIVSLVRSSATKATVSTIDNANSAFGQVSTALAVAGVVNSQVGQYGTSKGAQALFPTKTK